MTDIKTKIHGSSRSGALRPRRYVRVDRLRGRRSADPSPYAQYDAAMRALVMQEADDHFPHGSSPADLPLDGVEGGVELRGLSWAAGILTIGAVLLALLNTHAVTNWAAQQAPTAVNAPLLRLADGWSEAMASIGLDAPVEAGRGRYAAVKALRFPANEESGTQANDNKKPQ
jgi:hypothetical protein